MRPRDLPPGARPSALETADRASSFWLCAVAISNCRPSSPALSRSHDAGILRPRAGQRSSGSLPAVPASRGATQDDQWRRSGSSPLDPHRDAARAIRTRQVRRGKRSGGLSGGAASSGLCSPPHGTARWKKPSRHGTSRHTETLAEKLPASGLPPPQCPSSVIGCQTCCTDFLAKLLRNKSIFAERRNSSEAECWPSRPDSGRAKEICTKPPAVYRRRSIARSVVNGGFSTAGSLLRR